MFLLRDPYASAFSACGFRHETKFIFAGNGCRVDLDEFAIGVVSALLVQRGLCRAGADDGISGLAEDRADTASGDDEGIAGEGADFHSPQVHCADAAANAIAVENCA